MSTPIRLFVSDIDGTMTNGHMLFDHAGNVSKSYHTRDCTALWLLQTQWRIKVLMLTGSKHPCDRHRFKFLEDRANVRDRDPFCMAAVVEQEPKHIVQGIHDKLAFLEGYLKEEGLDWDEVAFIGDAYNDYECLKKVGWPACPKDAEPAIRVICAEQGMIMSSNGGNCAVFEFAQVIMRAQKPFAEVPSK